jgi:hypothetical protein
VSKVSFPKIHYSELLYKIDILIKQFLGKEYFVDFHDEKYIEIFLDGDNAKLTLNMDFFLISAKN